MNKKLKAQIIAVFGSQADFARELGGHESVVSIVVRNRKQLGKQKKSKWSKSLKCSVKDIFEG